MSGLHSANHWSFLRFLLSPAVLVTSVICNLPRERLCLEQISELFEGVTNTVQRVRLACSVTVFVILIRAINSSRNIQPVSLLLLFRPKTEWPPMWQRGCHINICIYILFRHLAHVLQQHWIREEGGRFNRTHWLLPSVLEMFYEYQHNNWQCSTMHFIFYIFSNLLFIIKSSEETHWYFVKKKKLF